MSKNKKGREMENKRPQSEENKQYNMQETEKKLNTYSDRQTDSEKDCD